MTKWILILVFLMVLLGGCSGIEGQADATPTAAGEAAGGPLINLLQTASPKNGSQ
jgi:uncharacterized protein YceK